jgi:hypothetical protein
MTGNIASPAKKKRKEKISARPPKREALTTEEVQEERKVSACFARASMATRMVQGAVISPSRAGLAYAVHTSAGRHSASLVGGVLDLHTRPAARRGERVDTAMSARWMLAAQHIRDLPGYVSFEYININIFLYQKFRSL